MNGQPGCSVTFLSQRERIEGVSRERFENHHDCRRRAGGSDVGDWVASTRCASGNLGSGTVSAPSSVRRSWIGGCACAATQDEAKALAEGRWSVDDPEDFGFAGTPQQVIDQMRPFIDLGIDHFMLDCGGFPRLTTIELLINDVLPALNA